MNSRTALVLIDLQANMFDPANPVVAADALLARLRDLLSRARSEQVPVVLVRNAGGEADPDRRGTPGWELHPSFQPGDGDLLLDKTTCDTFASTALGAELDARGITRLVIAGLQSDHCIRETTLAAVTRGLGVTLVANGHSTYDSPNRKAAEISQAVNDEFADRVTLVEAEEIHFPMSRTHAAAAGALRFRQCES